MQNLSSEHNLISGYGKNGFSVNPDSRECLAKKIANKACAIYFVKVATKGTEKGNLYNHMSPSFDERNSNKFNNEIGKSQYEFAKVSREVFDLYLQFLNSENVIYLRKAERARA